MQKPNPIRLLCLLLLPFASFTVCAQQVFKTTSTSVISYYEYVPQNYHANSDKYPVMIFLHGIGERGPNTTNIATLSGSIYEVAKHGPPMHVKNGVQFPFILISPQLKENYGTWPSWYVLEVINHVKTYLRIDEKRIYLTGLSLGGGGVWVAAQDLPELFAAIAPVCGGYNSPSKACNLASENLPVWAFHGDADTTVPMSRTVNMVNAINACTPTPSPLAKVTIYPNVGHNSWTKAYQVDHSIHNPNVYEWITSYTNTVNDGNKIPTANAGADQSITLGSITLNGSGSDTDGTIASYNWTQIAGPNVATLTNNLTRNVGLAGLIIGTYDFRLTVTDNSGNTDSDYVRVSVSNNALPSVSAGADRSITLPSNSVSITGTATDSDGTITTYSWSKVSGGTATLTGTSIATLNASALVQGTYVFKLTVTDDKGGSKSDEVSVTVNPSSSANKFPVVNAGSDKTITLPRNYLTLVGSATDSDGTIASYQWTKLSGPSCGMSNVTTAKLFANNLVEGEYTFRLTATDNSGGVSSDDVKLTVQPSSSGDTGLPNIAPVANAGSDKTLYWPSKALTVVGTATDADGTIASYQWTKLSGPSLSMSNTSTSKLWAYNMVIGTYVFRLTVTDNLGATDYDDVKVTIADGSVSMMSVENETSMVQPVVEENVLANLDSQELEDATVVVFDQSGEKLYSGIWTSQSHSEVMSRRGMYIYNVYKDGKKTGAGKILVR